MAKTIIGLFDDISEAQSILQELVNNGFDRDDISVLTPQEKSSATAPTPGWSGRSLSVSGLGSVTATGPLATTLADMSGRPNGTNLLDALQEQGVPADDARWYVGGMRRGGTLVSVIASDEYADRAADIMRGYVQRGAKGSAAAAAKTAPERSTQEGKTETIERAKDIGVPVATAYQQWTRFEEFPRFMEGVEEVRPLGGKRLHWVARIGGQRKEWDAQITEEIPDERLAWHSTGGEFTSGLVRFQPLGPQRSRVTVRMAYEPEGVTEKIGDWLGLVSRRVEGDLERFKHFVEGRGHEPTAARVTEPTTATTRGQPVQTTGAGTEGRHRFEDYEADFRRHYETTYARTGKPYDYWSPAYRYGYTLATDPRHRGRDWAAIETEARHDWQTRHQGNWDESKDAVYYVWNHLRGRPSGHEGEVRIPVVEEELQVGTREVEQGGVRVYSRITETPVEKEVSIREEHVHVERHPVDRPAREADFAAMQEGTIEMTETTEEPVVRKQARVVEEVVVSKEVEEHTETVRDTVRRTEVDVESTGSAHTTTEEDWGAHERDFRTHATTTFATRGQAYEHWAPAYRYGYELSRDPRYRGRDWASVEPEARRDWEQRRHGTWEEFKEAIRYGWEKVRGRR